MWLLVKENILNWPIGIANNIFFAVLFWRSRLFADMALQFVYLSLGLLGWYRWLYGGAGRSALQVRHTPAPILVPLLIAAAACTVPLTAYLSSVRDSAPFLDAATTTLSVVAQYMLTRKYIENWLLWIVADVLYVVMYAMRGLHLTAVLYCLFLLMCIQGWREWSRTLKTLTQPGSAGRP